MARFESSIVINRPIEVVFAFVANSENVAQWAGPVSEAKQISEGPIGVGTTSTRVTQFLGRRFESTYEVTEYQPNSKYSAKTTSGPMHIEEHITFEGVEDDTKVTIVGEADVAGFFKLAEPVLVRMTKRQMETDLGTLKDLLETQT